MSKAMKKARILSSESNSGVTVKQVQDTDIDLSIMPPAQQVNFQPCAMAELATMARPVSINRSTFNPILEDIRETQHPSDVYMNSGLVHRGLIQRQRSTSIPMVGPSAPESPPIIDNPSPCQESPLDISVDKEEVKEPIESPTKPVNMNRTDINGFPILADRSLSSLGLPKLRQMPPPPPIKIPRNISMEIPMEITNETSMGINDISIIDELKRPEEMLPNQPSIKKAQEQEQERMRLQEILNERTKRTEILEAMLNVYENKHQRINGMLTCKQGQLKQLISAYCGAESVELILEPSNCGCTIGSQKMIDIESIIVTVRGRTVDLRYGFNDAYTDMVRHGINLTQIIA